MEDSRISLFCTKYIEFTTTKIIFCFILGQVVFVEEDFVLAKEAYIIFYAKRGTPWFFDYIQIHNPFIKLVVPTSPCFPNNHAFHVGESNNGDEETSMKYEHNKTNDSDSRGKLIFYSISAFSLF